MIDGFRKPCRLSQLEEKKTFSQSWQYHVANTDPPLLNWCHEVRSILGCITMWLTEFLSWSRGQKPPRYREPISKALSAVGQVASARTSKNRMPGTTMPCQR